MRPGLPLGWRLRATALVVLVPPLVHVMSFSRLASWLGRGRRGLPDGALDDASLARWVDRLQRRLPGPWRRTCLKRSAVLYHLLRRAGRPVELWIGVNRSGGGHSVGAHAWLVRAGEPYLESHAAHALSHTVIARFPEARVATAGA